LNFTCTVIAMAMRVLIRFRAGRIANVNQAQPLLKMSSNSVSIRVDTDLPPGRGTILLVEDETFLRQVTCEILESAGYRVLQSRNAAEAISTFQEYKTIVRLLLTDVVLPGQNGRDLANDLRIVCPNLRIIFISGYPENAVTEHGIQEDGMFYLPKPFSLQALTRKVRQVLEEKETVTIEKTEMKGDCRTSD
jgi:two-component system, cell cycle sensor histidine kinase and response regulator CckA